jgi:outer membrane receptor protein involved in Fe transport
MKQSRLSMGLVAIASLAPACAFAQTVPDTDAIPQVIVSAQKRVQSGQDVAIPLTVLSGADLEKDGAASVRDLEYLTPSLQVVPQFGGGQPVFRLRGVGFDDYASNNSPTVTLYVDQTAYPFPIMTNGLLFDVDRAEVLRGPQGTLYGVNTTGGAVNILTNRPTRQLEAGASFQYGSLGEADLSGYVSGPITDSLRVRLSTATEQGGAWQTNRTTGQSLGDADVKAIRAQIDWDVTERLNLLLNIHDVADQSDNLGTYLIRPFATEGGAGPVIPADTSHSATGWGLSPGFAQLIGLSTNAKPSRDNNSLGFDVTLTYDLDFAKLTSISSYETFDRREYDDWDASASPESDEFFDSTVRVFSQELRLGQSGHGPVDWVAGAYYSNEKLHEQFLSDFTNVFGFIADTAYAQTAISESGFGQAEYHLTEELSLVAGLRYEHENRTLDHFTTSIVGAGPLTGPADRAASFGEFSGKAGINYKLDEHTLLYADISRGVKSGGFTAYNSESLAQLSAFKPEVLLAYEVGAKADLLGGRLRLNPSAYYYDYSNQQVQSVIIDPVFGAIGAIVNAPKSEIYGGEIEVVGKPLPSLSITQEIGYSKGQFDQFTDVNVAASLATKAAQGFYSPVYLSRDGQNLGFPAWSYNGVVDKYWDIEGYRIEARASYSYTDELNSRLGPDYNVGSYWLANASLTLAPSDQPWTIGVFGQNIFDQKYDLTRNFFVNAEIAAPGRPGSYGVRASYAF